MSPSKHEWIYGHACHAPACHLFISIALSHSSELSGADQNGQIIKRCACAKIVVVEIQDAHIVERIDWRGYILRQMKTEQHEQDVPKWSLPNIKAQRRFNATGRVCPKSWIKLRRSGKREFFLLQRFNVIDVVTAHRRAKRPNRKDDRVTYLKRQAF